MLAGLSSLISIIETYIAGLVDKFKISRGKAVVFGGGFAALVSLIFSTRGGLNFLDAADYFINQFGVAFVGLIEVVLVAWILRKLGEFKEHANEISDIRLGGWWTISLGVITPIVLGYTMYGLFRQNLLKLFETDNGNYEGYPDAFILYGGWFVAAGALVVGIIMALMKWKNLKRMKQLRRRSSMTGGAIAFMIISMLIIWGGLAASITNAVKKLETANRNEKEPLPFR